MPFVAGAITGVATSAITSAISGENNVAPEPNASKYAAHDTPVASRNEPTPTGLNAYR